MSHRSMLALAILLTPPLLAQSSSFAPQLEAAIPELQAIYHDLHQHPEIAFQEKRTAGVLAAELKRLGFEVTTGVGGTGVVGLLKNGEGPVVMLRTDIDGLPIEEKTGLPYASTDKGVGADGAAVATMHACGHDLHMTGWLGSARLLAQSKSLWKGTLMLVGQPAEETVSGATAMLKDGLFIRFPKPSAAISFHDWPTLASGKIGYRSGPFWGSLDLLDVTIFGRGGHGARPQTTVDPVVLASRAVLGLQTLISRENDPMEPAVLTVGAIHSGTVANVIPDQATLRISVRAFSPKVRQRLLEGIERTLKAEAQAAGAPKDPLIQLKAGSNPVLNDAAMTQRLVTALRRSMGEGAVVEMPLTMIAEDFAEYGMAGVPIVLFELGAVNPAALKVAAESGTVLPGVHSPLWAPDLDPSLRTLVTAEMLCLLELFNGSGH